MSDEEQFVHTAENKRKGTMEGNVRNLVSGTEFQFTTKAVFLDHQHGTLRIYGIFKDPESPGKDVGIAVAFNTKNEDSGKYEFDHAAVKLLTYLKYDCGNPSTWYWQAAIGTIQLNNGYPALAASGRLVFETKSLAQSRYAVNVTFDIS
ncbi:hypothetical protein ACYZT8_14415 [Pseudomonas sp. LB3P93]